MADILAGQIAPVLDDCANGVGKDIDSPQFYHVVAAPLEARDPLEGNFAAPAQFMGDVMRVETDAGGDVVLVKTGHNHVASLARRDRLTGINPKQFKILRVFPDIHPIAFRPFARDAAGIAHAIPVIGFRPVPGGLGRSAVFGPQMADDHLDVDLVEQAHLLSGACELPDIIDKADQRRDTEIGHQFNLFGAARFDARPGAQEHRIGEMGHGLADIVPAVDHAVTIDRLHHVLCAEAHPAIHPPNQQIADLAPLGAEHQCLRAAGCAGRGVENGRRAGGSRAHPVKIAVGRVIGDRLHQVRLVIDRQLGDIGKARDIARFNAVCPPQPLVERHLPAAHHQLAELGILNGEQLIPAHAGIARGEGIAHRIMAKQLLDIKGFKIGGIGHGVPVK